MTKHWLVWGMVVLAFVAGMGVHWIMGTGNGSAVYGQMAPGARSGEACWSTVVAGNPDQPALIAVSPEGKLFIVQMGRDKAGGLVVVGQPPTVELK